jgi:hypothetical protein
MLLGAKLFVHTDHKNILSIGDSSQQHLHWISYVDEYGPELHYVEGPHNVIADTFSRLLCSNVSSPLVGKKASNVLSNSESTNRNELSHSLLMDDKDIIDCPMNLPCLASKKKMERRQKNATLHYVEGPRNLIADTFSRLLFSNMRRKLLMLFVTREQQQK